MKKYENCAPQTMDDIKAIYQDYIKHGGNRKARRQLGLSLRDVELLRDVIDGDNLRNRDTSTMSQFNRINQGTSTFV